MLSVLYLPLNENTIPQTFNIEISNLIVEVLDDQNLFTESNLANWFATHVQCC